MNVLVIVLVDHEQLQHLSIVLLVQLRVEALLNNNGLIQGFPCIFKIHFHSVGDVFE